MTSFAETQKQRERYGANNQPIGWRDTGQCGSGKYPKDKTKGNTHHVQDNDMFNSQGISHIHGNISQNDKEKVEMEKK
jgi:hypothetical protein